MIQTWVLITVPCGVTSGELGRGSVFSQGVCPEGVTPGRTQRPPSHWWGYAQPSRVSQLHRHVLTGILSLHLVTKSCGEGLSILARAGLPSGDFVDRVASSGKILQVTEVGQSCMAPPPQASVTSEWTSEGLQWRCLPRPTTPTTRMAPAAVRWISRAWGRDQGPPGSALPSGLIWLPWWSLQLFSVVATAVPHVLLGTHPGLQPHHHWMFFLVPLQQQWGMAPSGISALNTPKVQSSAGEGRVSSS